MNCWMCGDLADTQEHKFKKSDLMRSSATWTDADRPYLVSGGGMRRIQGPRSSLVTFGKVLCGPCNSSRTQAYDRAYEDFSRWVNSRGASLMTEDHLDFALIYGSNRQDRVPKLLRYFAKHLGCRIASDRYAVPPGLAPSLATTDLRPFEVSFARNRTLGDVSARGSGILGNFPLFGRYSPSTGNVSSPYISGMVVGYLDVIYRYDYSARYPWEEDPLLPTSARVRLGLYEGDTSGGHPVDRQVPDQGARRIRIGDQEFDIPVLSPEHVQFVLSFDRPRESMTFQQNLDARLKIAHAILSPIYPEVTLAFFEENLTIPDTDALWRFVFS
jgi:hypothetical protein